MFIYFQQNKLRYEKGQLTPVFIVVVVILIIMAMITVNLGKIGLVKTDTSNAADAGALAGGSIMANVFNAQAAANQTLIDNHTLFLIEMGILAGSIIAAAYSGAFSCASRHCSHRHPCCGSRRCRSDFAAARSGISSARAATVLFHIAQYITYRNMRNNAEVGRDQAMELAYRYAFINSGIGNKLISGEPPSSAEDMRGDANNYSETFNDWVKGSGVTGGDYIWRDGQERRHQVHVEVSTQDVNNYQLQYALMPTALIYRLLSLARSAASSARGACGGCPCTAGATFTQAGRIFGYMMAVVFGLIPGFHEEETDLLDIAFPICWVVDINHNKRLSVTTWQDHQGQEYGLWNMQYPRTESRSKVDFTAQGRIYEPAPYFYPDIEGIDREVD